LFAVFIVDIKTAEISGLRGTTITMRQGTKTLEPFGDSASNKK
jgi:hypothetical protein